MRAGSSRSTLPVAATRALLVALLGSLSVLTGWVVTSTGSSGAAAAATAAGSEAGAASRLAAGANRVVSATGSGVTALGASVRVRPPAVLTDHSAAGDADSAASHALPVWAVLAASLLVAGGGLLVPVRVSRRLRVTGRSGSGAWGRAPPTGFVPAYAR